MSTAVAIRRLTTGIAELDEVLSGGLPASSINVLMGLPGTGKTILAQQIVFSNATPERPALYFSTLAEPLDKFIAHGQEHGFFDADRVGTEVLYEDLAMLLRERGLAALSDTVAELIARHRPGIIVIDSFKALSSVESGGRSLRQILFDFASMVSAFDCTTILVGEYSPESIGEAPEFAIADTILQLIKQQTGMREQRFIRIEKLRGSGYISGMHAFRIGPDGLAVYPRLLTPQFSPAYESEPQRVSSGISGLDGMVEKGFWRGTSTLLAGPSGSGKTSIAIQFVVAGARAGEPGLFVGFQENPIQFSRALANFGHDSGELMQNGRLRHFYHSPVEMQLDDVVGQIFREVRERRVRRVAIDSLGDLKRSSFDPRRYTEYMYALTQWCAVESVTSVLTQETPQLFGSYQISEDEISNMTDNVVLLGLSRTQPMERTLRIIKTRNSAHDHSERILRIASSGVSVGEPAPDAA